MTAPLQHLLRTGSCLVSRLVFRLGVALALSGGAALAMASPAGLWKTIDDNSGQARALVRITDTGGVFSARLERLLDPTSKPGALCDKCDDDRKNKPILGLEIVRGLKKNPDKTQVWDGGHILDPENGKTYRARMTLIEGGKKLEVRGYMGVPLLGRTQVWHRAE
jgi:uncharacterized protein (DUF2147 family)